MFHFGTNHANGGTASCRSAVFFGFEEEGGGMEEDFERRKEDGEEGNGTWRRRGEDLERRKDDSERTGTVL